MREKAFTNLSDKSTGRPVQRADDITVREDHLQELWNYIREHCAFKGIADDELKEIFPSFLVVSARAGEFLIQEGLDTSSDLLLVLEGNLEVTKSDSPEKDLHMPEDKKNSGFTIAKLSHGDIVGEFSFITGETRSATIKCIKQCKLLSISRSDFDLIEHNHPRLYALMLKNIMRYMAERVKQTSANEVRSLKTELENSLLNSRSNLFFSYVIGLVCVYNLVIHFTISLSLDSSRVSLISAIIIILFASGLALMVKHSRLPLKIIGLTTKNWKPAVKESLIGTAVVIIMSIAIKWILIQTVSKYNHLPLFHFDLSGQNYLVFNFILYGLHSPIQEFIARGVLQGSLQHFFTGKNVALRAIIVSNALFSATHVHLMEGMLAILVFIPGLFWGWLYSRHENLIGVSISHLLIGWTLLFFLDLESLF